MKELKEISVVEFNREHLIHELRNYFRKEVFFDEKDHEFYYLKESKDYYGKIFHRKRTISYLPILEFGYGNEYTIDDMLQSSIRVDEEISLYLLRLILEYYELVCKEATK